MWLGCQHNICGIQITGNYSPVLCTEQTHQGDCVSSGPQFNSSIAIDEQGWAGGQKALEAISYEKGSEWLGRIFLKKMGGVISRCF